MAMSYILLLLLYAYYFFAKFVICIFVMGDSHPILIVVDIHGILQMGQVVLIMLLSPSPIVLSIRSKLVETINLKVKFREYIDNLEQDLLNRDNEIPGSSTIISMKWNYAKLASFKQKLLHNDPPRELSDQP